MSNNKTWVRLLLSTLKQEGCTRSAALVLAVMADHATNPGADRRCKLSRAQIAREAGCTVKTVSRSVEQLERLGLIVPSREPGGVSCYTLTALVELPEKRSKRITPTVPSKAPRAPRRARRARTMSPEEVAEMNEYLSVSNRFKEDEV